MLDPAISSALNRVAAFGLSPRDVPVVLDEQQWRRFLSSVVAQRLTGLAFAAAEAGQLKCLPEQARGLRSHQSKAMLQTLALERQLLRLADALHENDVGYIVLKGPVLAHGFYPDPSMRSFVDLDILVRGRQWRSALALLKSLDFTRKLPEPGRRFDERFGKAALHTDAEGLQIDLHRTLVVGPFGLWMEPEELFGHVDRFRLGGQFLPRLDDTALFLNACVHASLGWRPPLLLPVRDVAQIALKGDVDWDVFQSWVARWHLGGVIDHSVRLVEEVLGVRLEHAASVLKGVAPSRLDRRALEAYTTDRRRRGGTALIALRAIPGIGKKTAYIRALLLPRREFLAARTEAGQAPSYLRRWATPLLWLLRRHRIT